MVTGLAISIRGLTRIYGDLEALDNFSMEVGDGEFFGFLGLNDAGKTSTAAEDLAPKHLNPLAPLANHLIMVI